MFLISFTSLKVRLEKPCKGQERVNIFRLHRVSWRIVRSVVRVEACNIVILRSEVARGRKVKMKRYSKTERRRN